MVMPKGGEKKSPMVSVRGLKVFHGTQQVLNGVDFEALSGEILTVMGGSGCGKSTLLRSIMRLIPIQAGEVVLDGVSICGLSERRMNDVRKSMGLVFQDGALFDSMTVFENVAFPLRRHARLREAEVRSVVRERLEAVDMGGQENKFPDELSGGMQRRVALARAMALGPKILLYDEPTAGLDPILTETVVELILKMRAVYGTTSVVVTHDLEAARRLSDRAIMLHEGRVEAQGTIEEMERGGTEYVRRFMAARNGRGQL